MQYTFKYRSPLGGITIAADDEGLTGLWFDGQKYFADTLSARHEEKMLPVFGQVREWLDCYFGGGIPGFTPPVHLQGSPCCGKSRTGKTSLTGRSRGRSPGDREYGTYRRRP